MENKLHIIKEFENEFLASLFKSRIEQEGFDAFIVHQNINSIYPMPLSSSFTVKLMVRKEDIEYIAPIINTIETELNKEKDFKEATHEDIIFEKKLNQPFSRKARNLAFLLAICILLSSLFLIINWS